MQFQPIDNHVFASLPIEINWNLVIRRIQLQSWESLNGDSFDFISSGIHFRNDNIGVASQLFSYRLINWGQLIRNFNNINIMKRNYLFAMTTPGSIELDKDILGIVIDDLVEGLSDHHLHRFVVALWDRLTSVERLQLSF